MFGNIVPEQMYGMQMCLLCLMPNERVRLSNQSRVNLSGLAFTSVIDRLFTGDINAESYDRSLWRYDSCPHTFFSVTALALRLAAEKQWALINYYRPLGCHCGWRQSPDNHFHCSPQFLINYFVHLCCWVKMTRWHRRQEILSQTTKVEKYLVRLLHFISKLSLIWQIKTNSLKLFFFQVKNEVVCYGVVSLSV